MSWRMSWPMTRLEVVSSREASFGLGGLVGEVGPGEGGGAGLGEDGRDDEGVAVVSSGEGVVGGVAREAGVGGASGVGVLTG